MVSALSNILKQHIPNTVHPVPTPDSVSADATKHTKAGTNNQKLTLFNLGNQFN